MGREFGGMVRWRSNENCQGRGKRDDEARTRICQDSGEMDHNEVKYCAQHVIIRRQVTISSKNRDAKENQCPAQAGCEGRYEPKKGGDQ